MNVQTSQQLALWLAKNQPLVFKQLVRESARQGQLRGVTDWLSAVGSSLSSAVQAAGSFIASPEGMATLGTIGGMVLQTRAQKDALKVQIANARAGYAPVPIESVGANPNSSIPIYVDPVTGQRYPLTSQVSQSLMPTMTLQSMLPWLLGGGLILVVLLFRK